MSKRNRSNALWRAVHSAMNSRWGPLLRSIRRGVRERLRSGELFASFWSIEPLESRVLLSNTWQVTNSNDTGPGSLRSAITSADSSGGTNIINFVNVSSPINLASALPSLTDTVTINGPGASPLTINGGNHGSVFSIGTSGTAWLENLTITGGSTSGISNSGTTTISGCTVTGNHASYGGGVDNQSGGTLTITSSTVSGNTATSGLGYGGGIFNARYSSLSVTNSTISGNSALRGGGINAYGAVRVTNSTVNGNSANYSGGIATYYGSLYVANSTIAGNTASIIGGVNNESSTTIVDSTVVGNSGSDGGGIWSNEHQYMTTINGSIVARNNGGDISGAAVTGSHDLIGDGSDDGELTNSLRGTLAHPLNPLLLPLGSFGGPTQTMALQFGSPAIGNGSSFASTDQRGVARPQGSGFDIGAYQSGVLVVNTLTDPATPTTGILSLREAISDANSVGGTNTISFTTGLTGTINLNSSLPELNVPFSSSDNLTIDGPGANLLTINGQGHGTVFDIGNEGTVEIENLKITGASASGVINNYATTTISNCTITGNYGQNGGGIKNLFSREGSLTIINSSVSENSAGDDGGGIYNSGSIKIVSSTISGNSAFADGGMTNYGSATVCNSTISGNSAPYTGGIGSYGGGSLVVSYSTIAGNFGDGISSWGILFQLTNSTVSGNHGMAENPGAGLLTYTATIIDSTISGNSTTYNNEGAGIYVLGNSTVTLNGTIVAGNQGDLAGIGRFSGSYDLIGDGSDSGNLSNSLTDISADLSALGNYGGPTQTMALLPGSPAFDTGATFNGPGGIPITTDQRGFPRPQGNAPDIGAYEVQPPTASINSIPPASEGSPLTITATVTPALGNGSDTLSYNWKILDQNGNPVSLQNGGVDITNITSTPTLTFTPTGGGAFSASLTVTDTNFPISTTTATQSFTVTAIQPIVAIFQNTEAADVGVPYTLGLSAEYGPFNPDNDTINYWSIDWGDGDIQTAIGNPSSVTHVFSYAGSWTISATATDNNATYNAVTPVPVQIGEPPVVSSFQVNDGNSQRSMVTSLTVTFSKQLTSTPAFVLTQTANTAGVSSMQINYTPTPSDNNTIYVLTFPTYAGGSLPVGTYNLTVPATSVTDAAGGNMPVSQSFSCYCSGTANANFSPTGVSIDNIATQAGGSPITLTGSGSPYANNGDSLSYTWSLTANNTSFPLPNGGVTPGPILTFTPTIEGTWTANLTVTDNNLGLSMSSGAQSFMAGQPTLSISGAPTADVGSPYILNLSAIYLPGIASTVTWVINWGDGNGNQDIQNVQGSSVPHTFFSSMSDTISATASDGSGQISSSPPLSWSVNVNASHPAVSSFQVNDGNIQRSMIDSLTLTFNTPVSLTSGAFTLTQRPLTRGSPVQITNFILSPTPGASTYSSTYVLTFTGSSYIGDSLPDGIYDLTVNAAGVTDSSSAHNNMANSQTFSFYRLFGDFDGTGSIDSNDSTIMNAAVATSLGQPGYFWYADYYDDYEQGTISETDLTQFESEAGTNFAPIASISFNSSSAVSIPLLTENTGTQELYAIASPIGDNTDNLTYTWSVLDNGEPFAGSSSGNVESFTPTDPGSWTVAVTVTDTNLSLSTTTSEDFTVIPTLQLAQAATEGDTSTATSITLSAQGLENGSGSSLNYMWAATSLPTNTALQPTFVPVESGSVNNSQGASSVTATFSAAGQYILQVTISDPTYPNATIVSDIPVTIDPIFTSIAVSPGNIESEQNGGTTQFTAVALDQFRNPMPTQPQMTWSASGGSINSSTGLYTIPSAGGVVDTITASATVSGSTITGNASDTVASLNTYTPPPSNLTATLTPNSYGTSATLMWTGVITGNFQIEEMDVNADSVFSIVSPDDLTINETGSETYETTITGLTIGDIYEFGVAEVLSNGSSTSFTTAEDALPALPSTVELMSINWLDYNSYYDPTFSGYEWGKIAPVFSTASPTNSASILEQVDNGGTTYYYNIVPDSVIQIMSSTPGFAAIPDGGDESSVNGILTVPEIQYAEPGGFYLSPGVQYEVRMSVDGSPFGSSYNNSNWTSVLLPLTSLAANDDNQYPAPGPTSLTETRNSDGSITLTAQAATTTTLSGGPAYYNLYEINDAGSVQQVVVDNQHVTETVLGNTITYVIMNPDPNVQYFMNAAYLSGFFNDGLVTPDSNIVGGNQVVFTNNTFPVVASTVGIDGQAETLSDVNGDTGITRYNSDGSPDATFGSNGTSVTDYPEQVDPIALAPLANGDILALGSSVGQIVLAEYASDGSLNTSFGVSGTTPIEPNYGSFSPTGMTVLSDGSIVVLGTDPAGYLALAHFLSNGTIDFEFGNNGYVDTNLFASSSAIDMAAGPNNSVVVVGDGTDGDYVMARYTETGLLDASFGSGGVIDTGIADDGTPGSDNITAITDDPMGNVVVVGQYHDQLGAWRYLASSGALDTNFGSNGMEALNFDPTAVLISSDSSHEIIVAGNDPNNNFAAAYLLGTTGKLDTAIIQDGWGTYDVGGDGSVSGVFIDGNGQLVLTGFIAGVGAGVAFGPLSSLSMTLPPGESGATDDALTGQMQEAMADFNYVYNNIQYQPYNGALKGPVATNETKAGNDWDQASLLIEMLFANSISSQYEYGPVELTLTQAADWLGLGNLASESTTRIAVRNLFSLAGISAYLQGSDVYFEHVWVSATINGTPVELDPSIKFDDYQPGIPNVLADAQQQHNVLTNTTETVFPPGAWPYSDPTNEASIRNQFLSQPQIEDPLTYYEDSLTTGYFMNDSYGALIPTGQSVADIPYEGPIIAEDFTLPPSPIFTPIPHYPYSLNTAVPSNLVHRVRITLTDASGSSLFTTTISMPKKGIDPITVDYIPIPGQSGYEPVVYAGGQTLQAAQTNAVAPVYTPTPINGSTTFIGFSGGGLPVASPTNTVISEPLGASITLTIVTIDPGLNAADSIPVSVSQVGSNATGATLGAYSFVRTVGQPIGIGLGAEQISNSLMENLETSLLAMAQTVKSSPTAANEDVYQRNLLAMAEMAYLQEEEQNKNEIAGLADSIVVPNVVEVGIMTGGATITTPINWSLQHPIYFAGTNTSNPGIQNNLVSRETSNNIPSSEATVLLGDEASALESQILQQEFGIQAVSTISGLQLEAQQSGVAPLTGALTFAGTPSLPGSVPPPPASYDAGVELTPQPSYADDTAIVGKDLNNFTGPEQNLITGLLENGWTIGLIRNAQLTVAGKPWGIVYIKIGRDSQGVPEVVYVLAPLASDGSLSEYDGGFGISTAQSVPILVTGTPQPAVGDPVDAFNGSVTYSAQDISFPNPGLSLDFTRYYNSISGSVADNPTDVVNVGMGPGWTYTFSEHLLVTPTGAVTWLTDDGEQHTLALSGTLTNGVTTYSYNDPAELDGSFTLSNASVVGNTLRSGTFTYYNINGTVTTFTFAGGSVAYLSRIEDRNDDQLTVAYSTSGPANEIQSVTASSPDYGNAHKLDFTWTNGNITSVTEVGDNGATRASTYNYGNGQLDSVTSPTPGGAGSSIVTEYQYNPSTPTATQSLNLGLLTEVEDTSSIRPETWQPVHQFIYYPNDLVFETIDPTPETNDSTNGTSDSSGVGEYFFYNTYNEGYANNNGYAADYVSVRHIDFAGNETTYQFDEEGQATKTIYPDGTSENFAYDSKDRLAQSMDQLGRVQIYLYGASSTNPNLRLVTNQTPIGAVFQIADSSAYPYTYSFASGPYISSGYESIVLNNDATEWVLQSTVLRTSTVEESKYQYDAFGNRIRTLDPNGDVTRTAYGTNGNSGLPSVTITANGVNATNTGATNASAYSTTYTYNHFGEVLTAANPASTITNTYDSFGDLTSTIKSNPTDPGVLTSYGVDSLGETTSKTVGGIVTSKYKYADGLLTASMAITPNIGVNNASDQYVTTTYQYDGEKRLVSTDNPDGSSMTSTYDADGNVLSTTNAVGDTTFYVYDWAGRVVETIKPDGSTWLTQYDGAGRAVRSIDGNGNTTWTTYDNSNNPTQVLDAVGDLTANIYDSKVGNLWHTVDYTTNLIVSSTMTGATIASDLQANSSNLNTYEAADSGSIPSLAGVGTLSLVAETSYYYDTLNRIILTIQSGISVSSTKYDADGNVVQQTLYGATNYVPAGSSSVIGGLPVIGGVTTETTTTSYTPVDQPFVVQDANKTSGTGNGESTTFTYNASGQVLTKTTVSAGDSSPAAVNGKLVEVTTDAYNLQGLLMSQTQPATYEYNGTGPGIFVSPAIAYLYNANGELRKVTGPNSDQTVTYSYDIMGRQNQVTTQTAEANPSSVTTNSNYDSVGDLLTTVDGRGNTTTYTYDAMGQRSSEKDPEAVSGSPSTAPTTTYRYDADGNLISTTDPRGTITNYVYDGLDRRVEAIQNVQSAMANISFDTNGNTSTGTISLANNGYVIGEQLAVIFLGSPQVNNVAVVTSAGTTVAVQFVLPIPMANYTDGTSNVAVQIGPVTRTVYGHNEIAVGNSVTTFNLATPPTGVTPPGRIVVLTIDPMGIATAAYSDSAGRNVETDVYQPIPNTPTGPAPAAFQMVNASSYDDFGNLYQSTNGVGDITRYGYDLDNHKTSQIQAQLSLLTTYVFDGAGNLISTTDPSGHVTTDAYDAENQLISETPPSPTALGQPATYSTSYYYDAAGNQTDVVDPTGARTHYIYDAVNRLVATYLPNDTVGGIATAGDLITYDADGNISMRTDPLGNVITYGYDNLNRQTSQTENTSLGMKSTSNTYDLDGNLVTAVDLDGQTIQYGYDKLNNQISETWVNYSPAETINSTYDGDGRLISETDNSTVETFKYDNLGDLIDDQTTTGNITTDVYSDYDAAGERIGIFNAIASPSTGNKFVIDSARYLMFDQAGRVTSDALLSQANYPLYPTSLYQLTVNLENPTSSLNYANSDVYDPQFSSEGGAMATALFSYYPDGQVYQMQAISPTGTATTYAVVQTTYSYNFGGQLTGITDQLGGVDASTFTGAIVAAYSFTKYDNDNRLLTNTYTSALGSGGATGYGTYTDAYDAQGELTGATTPLTGSGLASQSYGYNANGSRDTNGFAVGIDNQISSGAGFTDTYDPNGNLVKQTATGVTITYTWDYRNRLTQMTNGSTTISYQYDFENRRIGETVTIGSSVTSYRYEYDGSNLLGVINPSTGWVDERIISDPTGGATPLAQEVTYQQSGQTGNGYVDWLLADQNGSVQDMVGEQTTFPNNTSPPVIAPVQTDHVVFDEFGNKIVTDQGTGQIASIAYYNATVYNQAGPFGTPTLVGFQGMLLDPAANIGGTGSTSVLYYDNARWYSTLDGNFLNQDPTGFAAGDNNLYRFGDNDPVNNVDPTGLMFSTGTAGSNLTPQPYDFSTGQTPTTPVPGTSYQPIGQTTLQESTLSGSVGSTDTDVASYLKAKEASELQGLLPSDHPEWASDYQAIAAENMAFYNAIGSGDDDYSDPGISMAEFESELGSDTIPYSGPYFAPSSSSPPLTGFSGALINNAIALRNALADPFNTIGNLGSAIANPIGTVEAGLSAQYNTIDDLLSGDSDRMGHAAGNIVFGLGVQAFGGEFFDGAALADAGVDTFDAVQDSAVLGYRLDGTPFGDSNLNSLEEYLNSNNIQLFLNQDEFLSARNSNGLFRASNDGTGQLFLKSNPTQYEVWHELGHAFDFSDLVEQLGPQEGYNAYRALGTVGREQSVYNMLSNSTFWNQLNDLEQEHAINYIVDLGGVP